MSWWLILLVAGASLSAAQNVSKPTTQEELAAFYDLDYYVPYRSDTHDHFSWQLFKQVLMAQKQKNIIISPFSVKLMLSMLAEAAGNNSVTQQELLNTLTDIRSTENLRNFYKKNLLGLHRKNPYYTLNLETKMYVQDFIEPQQRFAALLKDYYFTDIERHDFSNATAVSDAINSWCNDVTAGRLTKLVNEENIKNSIMLMVNVIYFNGLWRRPFEESFDSIFFKSETEQVRTSFMEVTDYFYYHNSGSLDARMLRLPYKGKQYSMFIVLPKEKAGLDAVAEKLANDNLKSMQLQMEDTKVKVTLPKFKFDFDINMHDTLIKLGIHDIFTDAASLPGLARGADVAKKLKVTNMFQKAGIEVNEVGTEVFASTVVEIGNKFGGVSVIEEFNVNRPFLFFIEEEATGNIIFAGKVIVPLV